MVSGARVNVNFISMLGADCQSIGTVGAYLLSAPRHGSVQALPGDGHPHFPPDNPRSACNGRLVPGTFVTYRSERFFDGTDQFQVLYDLGGSKEARVTYVMEVLPPAPRLRLMPQPITPVR